MTERSWAARLPRVYDVVMLPIELLGMRALRARLFASLPADGRGLEIGAGTGASARHLNAGGAPVAIDVSAGMLLRARAREGSARPLAAADVQTLPFRDGAFDWAVASLVFCEVPDPLRGLREVRRVLRSGATLHLLEHVEPDNPLLRAATRATTRVTGPLFGEHFDRRTADTVVAAGFAIERAERWVSGGVIHVIARRE